jgi:hypothetical protein
VTKYQAGAMNAPQPLEYPEDDARAVAQLLVNSGYTTQLLLGQQATQQNIHEALDGLTEKGNDEGIVLIGFFGHGVEYELPRRPQITRSVSNRISVHSTYRCGRDWIKANRYLTGTARQWSSRTQTNA